MSGNTINLSTLSKVSSLFSGKESPESLGHLRGFIEHFLYVVTLGRYDCGRQREEVSQMLFSSFCNGPSPDVVHQFEQAGSGCLSFSFGLNDEQVRVNITRESGGCPELKVYSQPGQTLQLSVQLPTDFHIDPRVTEYFIRRHQNNCHEQGSRTPCNIPSEVSASHIAQQKAGLDYIALRASAPSYGPAIVATPLSPVIVASAPPYSPVIVASAPPYSPVIVASATLPSSESPVPEFPGHVTQQEASLKGSPCGKWVGNTEGYLSHATTKARNQRPQQIDMDNMGLHGTNLRTVIQAFSKQRGQLVPGAYFLKGGQPLSSTGESHGTTKLNLKYVSTVGLHAGGKNDSKALNYVFRYADKATTRFLDPSAKQDPLSQIPVVVIGDGDSPATLTYRYCLRLKGHVTKLVPFMDKGKPVHSDIPNEVAFRRVNIRMVITSDSNSLRTVQRELQWAGVNDVPVILRQQIQDAYTSYASAAWPEDKAVADSLPSFYQYLLDTIIKPGIRPIRYLDRKIE